MEVNPKQSILIQTQKLWIANRIRAIRNARGITQQELANRMDVHFTRVSDLEGNSTDYKISSLLRAAYALNVTMSEFMKGCPGWHKPHKAAPRENKIVIASAELLSEAMAQAGLIEAKVAQVLASVS